MLDILAEFIIELIQGRSQKNAQKSASASPPKAPQSSTATRRSAHWPPRPAEDWPSPPRNDPYSQDHPDDVLRDGSLTIEEVMRRMQEKASHGGADAPVLDPAYHPQGSASASHPSFAPFAPTPKPQPRGRSFSSSDRPRPAPAATTSPVGPARTYTAPVGRGVLQEEPQVAGASASGLEFIEKLRSNPAAAREAFVFSEIFGRPLGERM